MPSDNWFHTASSNGVRAYEMTASLTSAANSSLSQPRRPKPTNAKLGGNNPRLARSYTAGISFFRARSPVTPNKTSEDGPAIRFKRRSRGSRNGFPPRNADLFKVSGMVKFSALAFSAGSRLRGKRRNDLLELGHARCP